jgi:serine/threonine-protein kinase
MERIGKYVVHKAVVTHGYARLFLCHDPDLQVPVAIKVFDARPGADSLLSPAQLHARFVTEARTLAGFDHPYVITVKALDNLDDGRPYFVMPYMAAHLAYEIGKDLTDPAEIAEAAERDRPHRIPLPRALVILKQLSSALMAVHRRGMVHRAVKPSNILLTSRDNGQVKLADFSMVKLAERNLPMPDHWIGSPDYTAPEQRENATMVTARADVFSVGVLAYRLACGHLPNLAEGAARLDGDYPPALAELIARATDPDPDARPAHGGEMLALLDKVQVARPAAPVVKVVSVKRAPSSAPA